MGFLKQHKIAIVLASAMTISACGGSGGSDEPAPPVTPGNSQPTANAGTDQNVDEFDVVTLDGSLSADPDTGDILTYTWTQTAGTSVTLSASNIAQPGFDAPDVTVLNTPDSLTFQLTVSDGTASHSDTVAVTVNNIGLGVNTPPSADAGPDQTVAKNTTVNLDGSASDDPDGDVLTYRWLQTGGQIVGLSDANVAQPGFTAPDVAANATEILNFQLTVDDGTNSVTDTVDVTVLEALTQVNVSGKVSFQFALPKTNCNGLDLDNPVPRPIRGATVQLLDSNDRTIKLGETIADGDGFYSFSDIDANIDVVVRVRAELKSAGPAVWDVEVRDNVDVAPPIPPLTKRPLYAVDFREFNTGAVHIIGKDFIALTGWGGSSYTGDRQAAPFAILGAIMDAMAMVTAVDPTATFPDLDVYWSVDNKRVQENPDVDLGELTSTYYSNSGLYLLGDEFTDSEEFDDMVTIHEWGHYFEDKFSRSDSFGGSHAIGEALDPRVAFGEGFATALAAIALQKPLYCDTSWPLESNGFGINFETFNGGLQGWMNEGSIATLIYDLWDTDIDGSDSDSIGFRPIYDTMVGPQADVEAFTSLFTFASGLRPMLTPSQLVFVDSQLNRENIDTPAIIDQWAGSQTTAPTNGTYPDGRDVNPYYTELVAGAAPVNVCLNDDYYDLLPEDYPNKFGVFRHLRFSVPTSAAYTITASANPVPSATSDPPPDPDDPAAVAVRDRTDPDFFLHRSGQFFAFRDSTSSADDVEVFNTGTLNSGTHILRLQDWRFVDDNAASDYPTQTCFDVSLSSP